MAFHEHSDDTWTISSRDCWLPGIYDSRKTAAYAFQFPNDVLESLSAEVNNYQKQNRAITLDDLRSVRT